jgi:hypothetical protein
MYEGKQSVDNAPDSEGEEAEERGKAQMKKHLVLHCKPAWLRETRIAEHPGQLCIIKGMQVCILRRGPVAVNAE